MTCPRLPFLDIDLLVFSCYTNFQRMRSNFLAALSEKGISGLYVVLVGIRDAVFKGKCNFGGT